MTLLVSKSLWLCLTAVTFVLITVSWAQTTRPKQQLAPNKVQLKTSPQRPRNLRELQILRLESRIKHLQRQRLQLLHKFAIGSPEIRANERSLGQAQRELGRWKKLGLFELADV